MIVSGRWVVSLFPNLIILPTSNDKSLVGGIGGKGVGKTAGRVVLTGLFDVGIL